MCKGVSEEEKKNEDNGQIFSKFSYQKKIKINNTSRELNELQVK